MFKFETEISERGRVGEALKNGVDVASITKVFEPYRRTRLSLVVEKA